MVIRYDRKAFAEQTEHRRRIHARRIETAADLGLQATARRLARNYQLHYGRRIRVLSRRGRVTLPSGRPSGRRLPAGRVGYRSGRALAGHGPAASRGARGSPGRSGSGDPDLPSEPPDRLARLGRAPFARSRPGLGPPHGRHRWGQARRQARGVVRGLCRPGCRGRLFDLHGVGGSSVACRPRLLRNQGVIGRKLAGHFQGLVGVVRAWVCCLQPGHQGRAGRGCSAAGRAARRCACLSGRLGYERGSCARRGDVLEGLRARQSGGRTQRLSRRSRRVPQAAGQRNAVLP